MMLVEALGDARPLRDEASAVEPISRLRRDTAGVRKVDLSPMPRDERLAWRASLNA